LINQAPTCLVHIEHTHRGIGRHDNFHARQEGGDQDIFDRLSSSHMGPTNGRTDPAEET
jgi:hypothetical protein